MNGPAHYAEAERLMMLAEAEADAENPWLAHNLAAAQVHATLALTAATVRPYDNRGTTDHRAWRDAIEGTIPVEVPA